MHEKEEANMNSKFNSLLNARVRNMEKRQQAEMAALGKRIETKRREVSKKREDDTARLVQRNRNIVKMIDSKNVSCDENLYAFSISDACVQLYSNAFLLI